MDSDSQVNKIKRHEMWRAQYRARRYMEHLADDELRQRAKDIFLNLLVLEKNVKIGLLQMNSEGQQWMILCTHILEEFSMRFGPYPAGFADGFMQDLQIPYGPLAKRATEAVIARGTVLGNYLVKYGKAKYLKAAFESGSLRVAPASSYSDPSLHPAIHDKEMEFTIQPPGEFHIKVFDPENGRVKGKLQPIGNKITISIQSDYYVYCLSSLFAPRLFLDFNQADACLLITKPQDFLERIINEFERVAPGCVTHDEPVHYFDPLSTLYDEVDIYFCKHFRYAYQKEYRIVWLPIEHRNKLEFFNLTLGSLEDVSELITV